ncbi:unnamed protein product [Lampetra fluviatilis]
MDSDEGFIYDEDEVYSEEETDEDDDEDETSEMGEVEMQEPVLEAGQAGDGDEFPHEVLTAEQVVQHMVECIKEVNEVIEIPATTTRILLSHFNWDKEKLMERRVGGGGGCCGVLGGPRGSWGVGGPWYFDGNLDKLFAECHVINPNNRKLRSARPTSTRSSSQEVFCWICYLTFPPSFMTGLECGHRFCVQCWNEYLKTKIMDEGMGQTISCPAHGCDILVDDSTVM